VDEFDRSRNKTWWMNDGALDRYSRSWYKGRGFSAGSTVGLFVVCHCPHTFPSAGTYK
jgi:hypothetical protein